MAKPIPVNRRFLENHRGAPPAPPNPAPTPPRRNNYRSTLHEIIAMLRQDARNDHPDWEDELWDDADELEFEDEAFDLEQETLAMWDDEQEELDALPWGYEEESFHPEDEMDILEPEELDEPYTEPEEDAPVITARYSGTCRACGNPIRVGDRITRHAHIDAWVHVGCRHSQSRAPFYSMEARFDGLCRQCMQPIQVGQIIVNVNGRWIHRTCAPEIDMRTG